MSNLTLRSLHPDDLDRVVEIESSLTGRNRRAYLEKRLAVATAMPESFITCAVMDGDNLAGYGYLRILHGEFGVKSQTGTLLAIGVDPDYQGNGIGKMILSGIEHRLAKRDIHTLETQVSWSDYSMVNFFSVTGFSLGSAQIIERGNSPLAERVAPVNAEGIFSISRDSGTRNIPSSRNWPRVRPLGEGDLGAVVNIDTKLSGLNRLAYHITNFRELLDESDLRISLVAEETGAVVGFVMARIDYGEFGKDDKAAVIDTIGVRPDFAGSGLGHLLLSHLVASLVTNNIATVRTKVDYANFGLRSFLQGRGFTASQRLILTKEVS